MGNLLTLGVGDTLDNNLVASVQPLGSYSDVDAFLRGCMQNYGSKAVRRVKVLYYSIMAPFLPVQSVTVSSSSQDQWAQTGVCLERIFFTDHIAKQSDGLLIRIPSDNRTTTSMNDAPITSRTLSNAFSRSLWHSKAARPSRAITIYNRLDTRCRAR